MIIFPLVHPGKVFYSCKNYCLMIVIIVYLDIIYNTCIYGKSQFLCYIKKCYLIYKFLSVLLIAFIYTFSECL